MLPGDMLWSASADGTFKIWKLLAEQSAESLLATADADAAAMLDVESMVRAMLDDGTVSEPATIDLLDRLASDRL